MVRTNIALIVLIAALASSPTPAGATAQSGDGANAETSPIVGRDKFLGSANDFTNPQFKLFFNQVIPENAGK